MNIQSQSDCLSCPFEIVRELHRFQGLSCGEESSLSLLEILSVSVSCHRALFFRLSVSLPSVDLPARERGTGKIQKKTISFSRIEDLGKGPLGCHEKDADHGSKTSRISFAISPASTSVCKTVTSLWGYDESICQLPIGRLLSRIAGRR